MTGNKLSSLKSSSHVKVLSTTSLAKQHLVFAQQLVCLVSVLHQLVCSGDYESSLHTIILSNLCESQEFSANAQVQLLGDKQGNFVESISPYRVWQGIFMYVYVQVTWKEKLSLTAVKELNIQTLKKKLIFIFFYPQVYPRIAPAFWHYLRVEVSSGYLNTPTSLLHSLLVFNDLLVCPLCKNN